MENTNTETKPAEPQPKTKTVRLYKYADIECVCFKGGLLVPGPEGTASSGQRHVQLTTNPDGSFEVDGEKGWLFYTREALKASVEARGRMMLVASVKAHDPGELLKDAYKEMVELLGDEGIADAIKGCKNRAQAIAAFTAQVKASQA